MPYIVHGIKTDLRDRSDDVDTVGKHESYVVAFRLWKEFMLQGYDAALWHVVPYGAKGRDGVSRPSVARLYASENYRQASPPKFK